MERTRLNLTLTPAVKDRIKRLMEKREHENMTEVVRQALSWYEECVDHVSDPDTPGRVIFEDHDGRQVGIRV